MTLDDLNMQETTQRSSTFEVGDILSRVLQRALQENRLTCGLYSAVEVLQINPCDVMMCILPHRCSDVTMHIHHVLLEAFCYENDVKVLKVDSEETLAQMFASSSTPTGTISVDCRCILLHYPWSKSTRVEEDLIQYYKENCHVYPQPIISMPHT